MIGKNKNPHFIPDWLFLYNQGRYCQVLPFKDAKYDYLQLTTGSDKFGPEFHPF
jgi:hypothetical protein